MAPGTYGKLSLQLSWIKNIEFAGEYFADSKGYYKDAGFDSVDLVTGPVDSADALVVAGKIDVGLSAPDATARLIAEQGAPLKIIGATYQKNPFCILSLEEGKPIATIADLAGKTIGIQAGTNQSIFEGLLQGQQHRPRDVQDRRRAVRPDAAHREEGRRLHGLPDQRAVHRARPRASPRSRCPSPTTACRWPSETFCVTQETIDSDRDKLKAFLTAEIKGWNDAVADPAAGAKLAVETYGKGLGLDVEGQTEQLKAQHELVVSDDTKANGLFTLTDEFQAKIVAAIGALGTKITAADLFDMSLLKEIYAADPSLIQGLTRDRRRSRRRMPGWPDRPPARRHACSPPATRPTSRRRPPG